MISSTAIFAASDIEATLAYYKDVLGFESSWTWGEPPTFGSATFGGVTIMFNLQPELAANVAGHQHWIKADAVDELYRRHRERGAKIVAEIGDRPWGAREYILEDLNGYHLRFAGPPAGSAPPSREPAPEVVLERRKPTSEEFFAVAGQEFSYEGDRSDVLEQTWAGVVARSPGGDAVGVLRIVEDAIGWYSIWDVAVLPEWQGRQIGSRMMREALAMIRERSPGAIVYLFTFKHDFYRRLGFGEETVSMLRL